MEINTVSDMWNLLNNVRDICVGKCNMFIMLDGVKPLWEANGSVFLRGGTWSVVIRYHPWQKVFQELVMAVLGGVYFSTAVTGACFIPVNQRHCICKLWCTKSMQSDRDALLQALSAVDATTSRFKAFA